MNWIDDGYNETAVFGDLRVVYRPLPHRMRVEWKQRLVQLGEAWGLWDELIQDRIVWSSAPVSDLRKSGCEHWAALSKCVLGVGTADQERRDTRNLSLGVRLALLYPNLVSDCQMCRTWWVDPIDGEFVEVNGNRVERSVQPLLCESARGCPAGRPDKDRRLSPKNKQAYAHYRECMVAGFPDDPIVRRNARIISAAIRRVEQERAWTNSYRSSTR